MELKYEFYIGAKPEQVWDAFLSPKGTRQTFFGCVIESTFEVGSSYAYVGPGNNGDKTVHVYGDILAYELHKRISFIEHPGPSYYANHQELTSHMTFTLEEVGGCTKLTLVNNSFSANHPAIEKANSSWWMILSNIKTFAETGKALDFGW